ncbi:MAG: PurM [Bacilli bacterium]|nr:PurM [Bacilli bacterium]
MDAYSQSGVNIDAGNEVVRRIKSHVARTFRPEVLTGLGGFGGGFQLPVGRYQEPVLVSGTDGVGTKLKLAFALDQHDTIGIDAVAMCVNDILVMGAEPLFFLDYFATGSLNPDVAEQVVKGVADGCEQAGCALLGGETAEMPSMYAAGEYDIAGFAVGVAEKSRMIDGSSIQPGDVVLGFPSSGPHSNGFSLIRRIIAQNELSLQDSFEEAPGVLRTLGTVLLTPTRIYVKSVLSLLQQFRVKGMAHITGGGFWENIPRVLSKGLSAQIDYGSWPILPVFNFLQEQGQIPNYDMFQTFNMGIGLIVVVSQEIKSDFVAACAGIGENVYELGRVTTAGQPVQIIGLP